MQNFCLIFPMMFSITFLLIFHHSTVATGGKDVLCPDKKSRCPEGTTCCQLSGGGQYGCCPLPGAVCCADHLHCCPADTECDMQHQRCLERIPSSDGSRRSQLFSQKLAAFHPESSPSSASSALSERRYPQQNNNQPSNANEVADSPTEPAIRLCGGGGATKTTICHRESKCCRHKDPIDGSKSDGCCPFPNGQCCAHSPHCCMPGFACDSVQAKCVNEQENGITLTTKLFQTKRPNKHFHSPSTIKMCPDGTFCGSATSTCCPRLVEDSSQAAVNYDCCPFANANCCSYGKFCCPEGHKCTQIGNVHQRCQKMSIREKIAKLFFSNN